MKKNIINTNSVNQLVNVLQDKNGIEVDSSDNRIKSKTKVRIDYVYPDTQIFDNTFDSTFN